MRWVLHDHRCAIHEAKNFDKDAANDNKNQTFVSTEV